MKKILNPFLFFLEFLAGMGAGLLVILPLAFLSAPFYVATSQTAFFGSPLTWYFSFSFIAYTLAVAAGVWLTGKLAEHKKGYVISVVGSFFGMAISLIFHYVTGFSAFDILFLFLPTLLAVTAYNTIKTRSS